MEGWTDGRTHARIQDYLSWRGVGGGGGGSRADGLNTGSAHGTNTY